MSKQIVPSRGMRDFLPADKRKREEVLKKIRSIYTAFGYEEIETPAVEDIDRLKASDGGENLSMIFEILKRGLSPDELFSHKESVDLGLRYDLTLPLARFYASNIGILPSVFKVIQIGPVWRAERPQKGRFRQFTQCDIDIIGVADDRAEIELITITLLALKELELLHNVTVRLNDRRLLIDILEAFEFPTAVHSIALIIIDKIDKIGLSGVRDELTKKIDISDNAVNGLINFLEEVNSSNAKEKSFDIIPKIFPSNINVSLISKLKHISDNVTTALSSAQIRFDPTLVRGLGYYTGPIFEIEIDGTGNSIAGGGRYDGMIGQFCNKDVPACGFSLGFERIIKLLDDKKQICHKKLAMFYESGIEYGAVIKKQRQLIELGYEVTAIPKPKKFGKAIQRAEKSGFGSFIEIASQEQTILEKDIKSTTTEHS